MGPKPEFIEHVHLRRAALRAELATTVAPGSALVLEIGSAHGHFLVRYAGENPAKQCLGVDLRGERVERALRKSGRAGLANCHFIRAEARELIECLPSSVSLAEIWVLFPDPWPKKRHHKNRLLQPSFFDFLAPRARAGARLYFRTDFSEYFEEVAGFLPSLATWQPDSAAPWPMEHETVFQARAPSFQSLVAIRT